MDSALSGPLTPLNTPPTTHSDLRRITGADQISADAIEHGLRTNVDGT